jgi:antitoxin component YwqK of YwqJK toxin-antitoxin module
MLKRFLTVKVLIIYLILMSCNEQYPRITYFDVNGKKISKKSFFKRGGNGKVEAIDIGENGKMLKFEYEYKKGVKNGRWSELNEKKNFLKEGIYNNGMKNGKEIWRYKSGKKMSELFYKNDKLEGKAIEYYENGKKLSEKEYRKGVMHGKYLSWDKTGELLVDEIWENGKLINKIK